MRKVIRFTKAVLLALVGVSIFCLPCPSRAADTLDETLTGIDKQMRSIDKLKDLEDACLDLLETYKDQKDVGKIYATIALAYAHRNTSFQKQKVAYYCEKALKYPQEIKTASDLYINWSLALYNTFISDECDRPSAEVRRDCAIVALRGIKMLLDNKIPTQAPPPVVCTAHDLNSNNPDYEEERRKHDEEKAAFEKHELITNLISKREILEYVAADIYCLQPVNFSELKRTANSILKDRETVERILAKAQERLNKRNEQDNDESSEEER